jgi:hypothetical protein
MSLAERNRIKKRKDNLYGNYFLLYKKKIEDGLNIKDLDFSIFLDSEDFYKKELIKYYKLKHIKGIDIFDKK